MGSSKKAKDKDKNRDREHKKKKKHRSSRSRSKSREIKREKSRSRSRSKEIKRERRESRSHSRSRDVKKERRESRSPSRSNDVKKEKQDSRSRSRSPVRERKRRESPTASNRESKKALREDADLRIKKEISPEKVKVKVEKSPEKETVTNAGGSGDSLSIEETNALRAKLGLKPLDMNKQNTSDDPDKKNEVHKPAVNIGQQKKSENLREKLHDSKEKRNINKKLQKVKGLADSDSDDDAKAWIEKQKRLEAEKKRAEERARLLDQMDAEFGISSLIEKDMKLPAPSYTSKDLKGLKVMHDQSKIKEGSTVILTLADKGVLDEGEDELVNVNIRDLEKTEKNLENKKSKPAYNPYDMEEDEYGMLKPKDVLSKYDEEISGPKKGESFMLGDSGKYNAEHEKQMERIRQELKSNAHTLSTAELSLASDFLTKEEMDTKFKKRTRKVRKVKKSEMVKADDLVPLDDDARRGGEESGIQTLGATNSALAKSIQDDEPDEDMMTAEDFTGVSLDDEVIDDYHSSLALHRKLQQNKIMEPKKAAEKLLSTYGREVPTEQDTDPLSGDLLPEGVVLTATDEFCRNLGSIPTYGQSGNRSELRDDLMDFEAELVPNQKATGGDEEKGGWEQVEIQEERPMDLDDNDDDSDSKDEEDTAHLFEEENVMDGGLAAAVKHALAKGFLEAKSERAAGRTVKDPTKLLAKNYSVEDKKHDDIDEKFRKRTRGERYSGPLTDFVDKKYVPDFKLTYTDEHGRDLDPKEAFRVLSHKFHGKGSGKKKTEKRMKTLDEEKMMMTMSSTDTPLNTLARLKERQAKEKSAYIVLSGGSKTLTGNGVVK